MSARDADRDREHQGGNREDMAADRPGTSRGAERPGADRGSTSGDAPAAIRQAGETRSAEAWTDDWDALVRRGRFTQARTVVRTVGADPASVAAVEVLAEIQELAREKSWERALGRIERLADTPPVVDADRLERELHALRDASRQLDRREADQALEALAELDEPYLEAEAATQRGTAHILRDEPEPAREAFERALELDPRHYRAMTNLGNLALEDGEVDAAIASYEAALRINDDFANAHHNLGVALRRKGKVAKSVRALRRAQKAMQQQDADRAKAAAKGLPAGRILRWLLIAGIAVALYLYLSRRGIL